MDYGFEDMSRIAELSGEGALVVTICDREHDPKVRLRPNSIKYIDTTDDLYVLDPVAPQGAVVKGVDQPDHDQLIYGARGFDDITRLGAGSDDKETQSSVLPRDCCRKTT